MTDQEKSIILINTIKASNLTGTMKLELIEYLEKLEGKHGKSEM